MGRQVVRKSAPELLVRGYQGGDTIGGGPGDEYTERLLKCIPAEVVAVYVFLGSLAKSSGEVWVQWVVFFFGLVATGLYLWKKEKVTHWGQLIVSVLAYCVWVFAMGGPFSQLAWYKPIYGGLLLPMYTFLIPIFPGLIAPSISEDLKQSG